MLFSTSINTGSLREYDTSNGDLVQTLNPPLRGSGVDEGYFDVQDAVVAKNGWFWLEDDWYTRIIGICPSGAHDTSAATPPANTPEAPFSVLFPAAALVVLSAAYGFRRRASVRQKQTTEH